MLPLRHHEPRPFLAPILFCLLLALLANLGATGCGGRTFFGGGAAFSAGSVEVDRIETGRGIGGEIGHYQPAGEGWLGGVLAIDYAGYSSGNDDGPIIWMELQGRYRHDFNGRGRAGPYLAAGPSLGYSVLEQIVSGVILEVGYELRLDGPVAIGISLRERPAYFLGNESPIGDFHNTLMIGFDIFAIGEPPAGAR